jgi:hypothetical protein
MKRVLGGLWMVGAITAVIAVQALAQSAPLVWFDNLLNGARVLVPAGISIGIVGGGLLLGAAIHGMALDASRVQPGKISGRYTAPNSGGGRSLGFFKGRLLWGGGFYEESAISDIKHSWRSGEWLTVHRYFRGTLVLVGAPLFLIGMFATIALVSDVIAVRLFVLLALAYGLARLGFGLIRA